MFTKATSERGRDLIVYQRYTFYKEKHVNEGVKWRCTHRSCFSKLYLDECSIEPLNLPRKMISNSAKRKVADQSIYRPLKIIREEIVNSPVELTQQLNSNDINRIRNNIIYHEHRKNYPILPKSFNDTHDTIKRLKIKTNIDENFLLDNNSEKNIIIFSNKKN
ncbi:FLYWCH-type domain-containing protein [Aphis craccivora]|uniref:FLYWCH-type domain-containing protein n=1 Tax=Aphis craccivora TaxID=307492 RepID=A0A6G0VQY6_APHCR|nr:FLYWCH-type domain-containing protein [Aphis craccivora]